MSTTETSIIPGSLDQPWSVEDAHDLYQVRSWGRGYFAINQSGHLVVRPDTTPAREIDLHEVVDGLRERDLQPPVLLRFSDILAHRLHRLHESFAAAIAENEYRGRYIAAYPVKVNQQRPVVEEIYRHGGSFDFGLEVGSKPELLAVMGLTADAAGRLIICNGFKDDSYIEAVILASKLGRNIIPVVENLGELDLVIRHARAYDVRPQLGLRVKLASHGVGRWGDSVGAKSKFGLFVSEVLTALQTLRRHGMEDCLQLVHCHAGSQLQDVRRIKDAVSELAHVYAELVRLGAGLRYIDVGGGLGVDYDGSQTNFPSSMNYTLEEYASEVVYRICSVCNDKKIDHPAIISESGRAIAAYQSVLVFNVLGSTGPGRLAAGELLSGENGETGDAESMPQPIRDLLGAYESVGPRRLLECFHDAMQAREQAFNLFNLGYLTLEERGLAERLFWATCARVRDACRGLPQVPEELADLEVILGEIYFCNVSVFQSMPDSWAIGQLFPIMPIHRLDQRPTCKAVLADITCDSEGKIDRFVDVRDIKRTVDLHEVRPGEPYFLAAFLVGAYQETLGDLHNLFGDTHVVHIRLHEEGGWWIDEVIKGDTCGDVLRYVQYDTGRLHDRVARDCELAVRDGRMTLAETRSLLRFYRSELNGYTYLEPQ